MASIDELRKRFEKKKSSRTNDGPKVIRLSGKTKKLLITFLTEPTEWQPYEQIWDQSEQRYVYITDENRELYEGQYPKTKYLANVIDVVSGASAVLDMGPMLAKNIFNQIYDRKDTLLGFDVEVFKTGTGIDTEYFCSKDDPHNLDLDNYIKYDLEEVVAGMIERSENRGTTSASDLEVDDSDSKPRGAVKLPRRK